MARKKQVHSDSEKEVNDEENAGSSGADDEVSDTNDNEDENGLTNLGWADSILKILNTNKPKRKRTIVLSKAKKLTDAKKVIVQPAGFEIQTAEGDIKEEKIKVETEAVQDEPIVKKKRKLTDLRIKPNILEKDRERTLQKIGTKGVVQLFNAVKSQQKQISEKLREAGPLEVKKDKALKNIDKRAFLDVLMGEKSQKVDEFVPKVKKKKEEGSNDTMWSVLKDDFMLSAKMKDWDKELEDSDDVQNVD